MDIMHNCTLCPRNCCVDRTKQRGFCSSSSCIELGHVMLHHWEEPSISGTCGSGTVFFTGCNLKCCFCQNAKLSIEQYGKTVSTSELADIFIKLQDEGAHNINLVTASHFVPQLVKTLDMVKHKLKIPVVYNTSSYEKISALKQLEGYVDIYLPDLKYKSSLLSEKYSHADDYFEIATLAIGEMFRQVGSVTFDERGLLQKGIIIRHLILPSNSSDSIEILQWISEKFSCKDILISVMSQYTPQKGVEFHELTRRIYTLELQRVTNTAKQLGLLGYYQGVDSAQSKYTPNFSIDSIL